MKNNIYKVLALKYRPKNFKELIGQDIMIETITNSIKLNKLPNAYLLNGIRGVGKTTTARLIAKAINCNKNFIKEEKCNKGEYCHCEEISNSKHLDVLEMDAASRTGIDDIRELIDSSKYNPTTAKYKIIILDEVHMLSKQAFNGLLKTLEEPPPHLKFIFATTEVKKIPVTIISRCQRFDLHRVSVDVLVKYLQKILDIEKGKISLDALTLIAKAAEGSVRDSLSLLDRALISKNIDEEDIDEKFVRKMLGIADRTKTLNLIRLIFQGNQKKSIDLLREMINEGIQPANFLNDLLEIIYFIQQNKILGNFDSELSISESEKEIISSISKDIDMRTLVVFWQFILKVIDELSVVSNTILSLEMLVVRLVHLKDMPDYESLVNEDLIYLASKKREIQLKYDLEKNVNLIKFSEGKIDISFNQNLDKNFVRNLSAKLAEWTGNRWVITLSKEMGKKTFFETQNIEKKELLNREKEGEFYKNIINIFSDAELLEVKKKD